jgi:hypothetical protein
VISHLDCLLALRTRLLTLAVATSDAANDLSASATGYARAAGSFLTDGFLVGMEVVPTGFTQTDPGIISAVSATTMTIVGGRTVQAAGDFGLSVGVPPLRAWENVTLTPAAYRWFIEEEYLPGPSAQITLGALGEIETLPQYIVKCYGTSGHGAGALYTVAKFVLALFPPRLSLTAGTDTLRVRTNPAPYRGQLLPGPAGFAVVVCTIPLSLRSPNTL